MTQPPTLTGQGIAEAQGVRALLDSILDRTANSSNEYFALSVLAVRGPWGSPAALHEYLAGQPQLGLDPPVIARLLGKMEAKGLASGTSADGPGPAQVTPEGAALHAKLTDAIATAMKKIYAGLDVADLATAHDVLAQVTERAALLRREL